MMVTKTIGKLVRKAGYNTQLIIVPAHMVTDSQYPFREEQSVVLEIKDGKTVVCSMTRQTKQQNAEALS